MTTLINASAHDGDDIAGMRALLVRAKDEAAKSFYTHRCFEPFPGEPPILYRLLKDLREMNSNRPPSHTVAGPRLIG